MTVRALLNQYELDTVQASLRDKSLNFAKLSEKNIVVSGSAEIVRIIVLSLLFLNDECGLNNRIIVLSKNDIPAQLKDRSDLLMLERDNEKIDIWLEASFFEIFENISPQVFNASISKANKIIEVLKSRKPKQTVLISNTEVYGKTDNGMVLSEHEIGNSLPDVNGLNTQLMRSVENLFNAASHQYGLEFITLRAANLMSDFSNCGAVNRLIRAVVNGEEIILKSHSRKVSYIYINDLITALYCVVLNGRSGEAYNACGDDSTVSAAEIAAIADELFEKLEVGISKNGMDFSGCAVDNLRLKKLGWKPQVNVKDALLLSVNAASKNAEVFMYPDAYDGKLNAIQNVLLGFLLEVDRICKKHDIKYFLGGGTLLGAIRHKGFIPWDDDADVMMLRDDYEKFLCVLPDELPDFIFAQTRENEKASHYPFTKLRINNTVLSTEFSARFPDIHNGVFLDVLAQDKTSNHKFARKIHMKATARFRWLVLNKWRKTPVDANNKAVAAIADFMKAIFPLRFLEWVQNRLMAKYKNKRSDWLYDSMGRNVENGAFPKEWLNEAVYVDFEHTRLPVPKQYDKYLTYLYGDYMNMVPVSKRHVSHDIVQIDLGGYLNYRS